MNIQIVHGRLTRDPEFKNGPNEKQNRTNFTVASDRRYGDETDFFDCVIFGKRAEVIHKFFRRGSQIVLYGEGQIRSYDDKNGVRRKAYSILVSDFSFCGSRSDEKQEIEQANFEEINEDIPF